MSIRFDAAADRLTYTGSIPVPTAGLTITAWVKIVNDRNDFQTWFRVYNSTPSTVVTSATEADGTAGNNYFAGGGSASNAVQMGTGTWRAVAISHDVGTTGKAYVRIGSTTTVNTATVSSSTPAGICIGGRDSTDATEWFDGEMAQVRIWSTELTQAQIEAEWASATPVITSGAYANWPLANATDLTDTVASRVLTTPNGAGQSTGADSPPNGGATVVLDGKSSSASGATGTLRATRPLVGKATEASSGQGTLYRTRPINGISSQASSAQGTLGATRPLDGSAANASGAAGSLTATVRLSGDASGASGGSGALNVVRALSGVAASASGGRGDLSGASTPLPERLYARALTPAGPTLHAQPLAPAGVHLHARALPETTTRLYAKVMT